MSGGFIRCSKKSTHVQKNEYCEECEYDFSFKWKCKVGSILEKHWLIVFLIRFFHHLPECQHPHHLLLRGQRPESGVSTNRIEVRGRVIRLQLTFLFGEIMINQVKSDQSAVWRKQVKNQFKSYPSNPNSDSKNLLALRLGKIHQGSCCRLKWWTFESFPWSFFGKIGTLQFSIWHYEYLLKPCLNVYIYSK